MLVELWILIPCCIIMPLALNMILKRRKSCCSGLCWGRKGPSGGEDYKVQKFLMKHTLLSPRSRVADLVCSFWSLFCVSQQIQSEKYERNTARQSAEYGVLGWKFWDLRVCDIFMKSSFCQKEFLHCLHETVSMIPWIICCTFGIQAITILYPYQKLGD